MIRQVAPHEANRVVELLQQLWPEKVVDSERVREIVEMYAEDPSYWIYGYEEEGVLLGIITVSFRMALFYEGKVGIIEDLVVDESLRGEGIGRRLVGFVEDKTARESRAVAIEVSSDLHRTETHTFWEGCGYSKLALQLRKEL